MLHLLALFYIYMNCKGHGRDATIGIRKELQPLYIYFQVDLSLFKIDILILQEV